MMISLNGPSSSGKFTLARTSLDYLCPQTGYDLTVDTFQMPLEVCARQIAQLFRP